MHDDYQDRIRLPLLMQRVTSAAAAADWIQDGMTVGMSGFTRAGDAKAVPLALAERARREPLKITLMTGASLGNDVDKTLTEAGALDQGRQDLQHRADGGARGPQRARRRHHRHRSRPGRPARAGAARAHRSSSTTALPSLIGKCCATMSNKPAGLAATRRTHWRRHSNGTCATVRPAPCCHSPHEPRLHRERTISMIVNLRRRLRRHMESL